MLGRMILEDLFELGYQLTVYQPTGKISVDNVVPRALLAQMCISGMRLAADVVCQACLDPLNVSIRSRSHF